MIPVYNSTQSKYSSAEANPSSVSRVRMCWPGAVPGHPSVQGGRSVCAPEQFNVRPFGLQAALHRSVVRLQHWLLKAHHNCCAFYIHHLAKETQRWQPQHRLWDEMIVCTGSGEDLLWYTSNLLFLMKWKWNRKAPIFECFCLHFGLWNSWISQRGNFKDLTTSYSEDWVGVFSGRVFLLKSFLFLMSLNTLQSFTLNSPSGTWK